MKSIEEIKNGIQNLYESGEHVHISIRMTRPRLEVTDALVEIKGVYPHMFRVAESASATAACHSIRYADILTGQVKISELK